MKRERNITLSDFATQRQESIVVNKALILSRFQILAKSAILVSGGILL